MTDDNQAIKAADVFEIYARQLVQRKGDTEDKVPKLVDKLSHEVDEALIDSLPDEGLEAMSMLDDDADESMISAVFQRSGVDEAEVMKQAMVEVGRNYLTGGVL